MERIIKFRAWWKTENKMLHNVHLFYDMLSDKEHGNEYEPESSFGALIDGYDKDDYIVMQYTGLKDKNGKEVYEGDILKLESGSLIKVIYHKAAFKTKRLEDGGVWFLERCGKLEVIGNKFETPNLLSPIGE